MRQFDLAVRRDVHAMRGLADGTQYRIAELRGTASQQPCSGRIRAGGRQRAAVHADVRTRVLHLQGGRGIALRRDPRTRQRPLHAFLHIDPGDFLAPGGNIRTRQREAAGILRMYRGNACPC